MEIVTAIDLCRRVLPGRTGDTLPNNAVINTDVGVVNLLVDKGGDVLQVPGDRIEPPPVTLHLLARVLARGAYKLKIASFSHSTPSRSSTSWSSRQDGRLEFQH